MESFMNTPRLELWNQYQRFYNLLPTGNNDRLTQMISDSFEKLWETIKDELAETNQIRKIRSFYSDSFYSVDEWAANVGPGWKNILSHALNNFSEDVAIVQIKEKFGGLRLYIDNGTTRDNLLVEEAETLSYETCENCGAKGECGSIKGWLKTLCERCRNERTATT